jgi:hypothetical protein
VFAIFSSLTFFQLCCPFSCRSDIDAVYYSFFNTFELFYYLRLQIIDSLYHSLKIPIRHIAFLTMRFSFSLTSLLAAVTVNAEFLLPQPMSNIPTGLPDRITWTIDSISGPLSLYLVPAGSQDPDSAILTIADQIPNYGIYQWVPRDTIETSESAFSILMVDSTNAMTVSGTFYLDGLLSTPSNGDLRRRDPVYIRNKESPADSSKSNQSVALNPADNTCGPPVTVTKTMIVRGTGGASTKTKGSSNAGSTGTLSSGAQNSTASENGKAGSGGKAGSNGKDGSKGSADLGSSASGNSTADADGSNGKAGAKGEAGQGSESKKTTAVATASVVESKSAASVVDSKTLASSIESKVSSSAVETKVSASAVETKASASAVETKASASSVNTKESLSSIDLKPTSAGVNTKESLSSIDLKPTSSNVETKLTSSAVETKGSSGQKSSESKNPTSVSTAAKETPAASADSKGSSDQQSSAAKNPNAENSSGKASSSNAESKGSSDQQPSSAKNSTSKAVAANEEKASSEQKSSHGLRSLFDFGGQANHNSGSNSDSSKGSKENSHGSGAAAKSKGSACSTVTTIIYISEDSAGRRTTLNAVCFPTVLYSVSCYLSARLVISYPTHIRNGIKLIHTDKYPPTNHHSQRIHFGISRLGHVGFDYCGSISQRIVCSLQLDHSCYNRSSIPQRILCL